MSLRDRIRTLTSSGETQHQSALVDKFCEGSDVRIGDAAERRQVRVCGEVTRIRTQPTSGVPTLEVRISDGSGHAVVIWHGRRALGGIGLGHAISIEGVATRPGDNLVFRDPKYTLLD